MHPYWVQKIEESRKNATITFWVVAFLIVILPLMLVLNGNLPMTIAIVCFVLAGLRIYSTGELESEKHERLKEAKKALENNPENTGKPAPMPIFDTSQAPGLYSLSESDTVRAENQLQTEFSANPNTFFTASLEPGQALNMELPDAAQAPLETSPQQDDTQVQPAVNTRIHFHDLAGH